MTRTPPALAALALALATAAPAWADPPQIKEISPFGARRGTPAEVAIGGGNLAGNPQLVAPFAHTLEALPNSDAGNFRFKLTVAPGAAVGVYPVRVRTDDGISNPFLFAIGQVEQVAEKEDNNTFEAAQTIPSPVVVEGQSAGNDVDFFKFAGKKGQRIVVDAQCARIGSGVDPAIRLTTAARHFVASADDTAGLMTDARLTAVLPEDGEYVVELSDSKYQGGGRPVYRLLIGEIPVAEEVYPLGGRRGETVGFELRGGTLADLRLAAALLNPMPGSDGFRLQVPGYMLGLDPNLELETAGPLEISERAEVREPADPKAPPIKVVSPVTINGRIDPAGDEDRFVVAVNAGQAYKIQVHAADHGSALDGTLQVLKPDGGQIAQGDDTNIPAARRGQKQPNAPPIISPDPSLNVNVPGGVNEITLALRDLEGRGGIGFPYRITVEPVTPGFEVELNDAEVSIPRGGTAVVGVSVTREGFGGPLTLGVADPPPGLTIRPGTIPDGQGVGAFSITAAADANVGPVELNVTGTGQGPGGPIVERASKLIVFAQQANLPTNLQHQRGLAASTALPRPASVEAPAEPVEVVHGFGATAAVAIKRGEGGEGGLSITPLPLPAGLAVPEAKAGDKDAQANVAINAAPEAPLGLATIGLIAKGKLGGKDQVLGVPALTVNVVRPAAIELASPNAEIKAGATVEVKGKVVRKGPFKDPVTVKLNGLPAGLKAEPVTVAPDASEFTLKLVAEPNAAEATANAQAVLAFQINKKDYSTPPAPLAVKVVK